MTGSYMNKQSKNTIKSVLTVLAMVILGEGILGWGLYWPFLLTLLNWNGIYWLALMVGILISVLRGIAVGLPSLFLLVVVGGLALLFNNRKELNWVMIIISVVACVVFDLVFGLGWSVWEVLAVILTSVLALTWFERSETIRINY